MSLSSYPEITSRSDISISIISTTLLHNNPIQKRLDDVLAEIEKEAQDVEHFKEEKVTKTGFSFSFDIAQPLAQMSELLDHNVKLSDLQSKFSSVFETTAEKKRVLENMEERKIEKRFYIL